MVREQILEQALAAIREEITIDIERDYFDLHRGRYQFILNKIIRLPIPNAARILDVGCYPPHLLTALQHLGHRVSGVASQHEPIESPHVVVLNIEKDALPFRSHTFDLVLFSEVMEHLVVAPQVYLSEFRRVLKHGGVLAITTPNAAGLHKLIPILFGRSTYFPLEQLFATSLVDGSIYHRHNREFTMNELREVLDKTGFTVSESEFFSAYKKKSHVQHPNDGLIRSIGRSVAYSLMEVFPTRRDTLYIEAAPGKKSD